MGWWTTATRTPVALSRSIGWRADRDHLCVIFTRDAKTLE